MRRIAVIGASGFVGATLVERLLANGGDEVVPFIHSSGNAMRLARRGADLKMLDLLNPEQVDSAFVGVTHIVNCSRGNDEVMITGLKNLLAAARAQRIKRYVHLSSVAVYGEALPPETVHESVPGEPARGTYGWTKLQQDQMIKKAADTGLPATILCPPNIAGPYSYFLISLVKSLRAGRFALLEDGRSPCNLVDVSNLCHAIELALDNGPPDGARMFVTDDEDTNWRTVVESVASLVPGQTPPSVGRSLFASSSEKGADRASVARSLKHLVSSEVRQAIRKDPLLGKLDFALRRGVAKMGKAAEGSLRLSVEGPTKVAKADAGAQFDLDFCRQQLRNVKFSCDLAKSRIGYRPLHGTAESMAAFRKWYRTHHGMDTDFWPLIQQLY